jgi:CBS domain-containing protein
MCTVQELLRGKGREVLSIEAAATVLDAAVLMNKHKIGSLLVMDGDTVTGIITERDLLQRVLAVCRDAAKTLVSEVMTTEMLCCQPYTTVEEARGVMKNHRVRHLPVVDDQGELHGMISIGDLNAYESHSQEQTIHMLHTYINGRT